ncbi:MAG TPA: hypothetical protein DEA40_08815 [Parvularcula sp.]|nr:hypothetical protein [Parvularcula sp.]
MRAAFAAGVFYFAIVFAAGFVLGAARIGLVAPAIGEMNATIAESPVILAASWFACLAVLRRAPVEARLALRLLMGAVAFALMIAAEIALGLGLMNRTPGAVLREMASPPALVGLGGQVLFALFPTLAMVARRR